MIACNQSDLLNRSWQIDRWMVLKNFDGFLLCALKEAKLMNKEKKSVSKIVSEKELWQVLYHLLLKGGMRWEDVACSAGKRK